MQRNIQTTALYLYSFWNPRKALKDTLDLILSDDNLNSDLQHPSWAVLYSILASVGDRGIEIIRKRIPHEKQDGFWFAFGLSQKFPMGLYAKNKDKEFAAFFHASQLKNDEALLEYLEKGSNGDGHSFYSSSITWTSYQPEPGRQYWIALIAAHWYEKIDNAFENYLEYFSIQNLPSVVVRETYEQARLNNNYFAFAKLIETLITSYKNQYPNLREAWIQNLVADFVIDYSVNKTLSQQLVEDSQLHNDNEFLNGFVKLLPLNTKIGPIAEQNANRSLLKS